MTRREAKSYSKEEDKILKEVLTKNNPNDFKNSLEIASALLKERIGTKRSSNSVRLRAERLNIIPPKNYDEVDYNTQNDFITSMGKKYKIRKWIIIALFKEGVISSIVHKYKGHTNRARRLLSYNEWDKWEKFFSKYLLAHDATKELILLNKNWGENILYHWIEKKLLHTMNIGERKHTKIWLCRDCFKFAKNILLEHYTTEQFANLSNRPQGDITKWVKTGKINGFLFNSRIRIPKEELPNFLVWDKSFKERKLKRMEERNEKIRNNEVKANKERENLVHKDKVKMLIFNYESYRKDSRVRLKELKLLGKNLQKELMLTLQGNDIDREEKVSGLIDKENERKFEADGIERQKEFVIRKLKELRGQLNVRKKD